MNNFRDLILNDVYDSGRWCGDIKRKVIIDLILKSNAKLCVEIGVLKGSSLMCFAEGLCETEGKVIGIVRIHMRDSKITFHLLIEDLVYNKIFTGQEVLDSIYFNLIDIIEKNNLNNIIQLVRDFSENYYTNINNESIDILHIDGNHDEKHVTMDILYYLPLVKTGGYVIMDDITWDGVIKSVNNHLLDKCDFIGMFNNNEFAVYTKR